MQQDVLSHQKQMIENMTDLHHESLRKIAVLEKKIAVMNEYIYMQQHMFPLLYVFVLKFYHELLDQPLVKLRYGEKLVHF